MRTIVIRPWLWPAAALYAAVLVQTRRRARAQLTSSTTTSGNAISRHVDPTGADVNRGSLALARAHRRSSSST